MITLRRSAERGRADWGWLHSYHTFSFANYYDPKHMGFRSLRVINEDRIAPGKGFETHGHRDMEIITYVLEGALAHRDNVGNSTVIKAGEFQRMSAGTGILHSEFNASETEPVHLLQIWIVPDQTGLKPGYEQKALNLLETPGEFQLIASSSPENGSLAVHQDVSLSAAILTAGDRIGYPLSPGRHAWLQVVGGEVRFGDTPLGAGDGVAVSHRPEIALEATDRASVLLFDLA